MLSCGYISRPLNKDSMLQIFIFFSSLELDLAAKDQMIYCLLLVKVKFGLNWP